MSKFLWNVLKISGGANAPNAAPGCAPADYSKDLLDAKHLLQFEVRTVFDSKML